MYVCVCVRVQNLQVPFSWAAHKTKYVCTPNHVMIM